MPSEKKRCKNLAVIGARKYGKLPVRETKGGLRMTAQTAWEIFIATGLPEVYNIYCKLREEERQAREKTA